MSTTNLYVNSETASRKSVFPSSGVEELTCSPNVPGEQQSSLSGS